MKKKLTSVFFILLITVCSYAQDAPSMYAVYESHVKPSMNGPYRDAVKKFVATSKQHGMTYTWLAGSLDDNSYVYLIPIKGFADLDKNMFDALTAKIGNEAIAGLWQGLDKCVESQSSSVEVFLPKKSYLSPGPDDNFRNVLYWYPDPSKMAEADALIDEWIKTVTSKKSPSGFQTYQTLFGNQQRYIFVSWGKDEVDHAQKLKKDRELMGDELSRLWSKTMLITKSYYTKVGWIEGDLSYIPIPK
jgi:hypothetical protein